MRKILFYLAYLSTIAIPPILYYQALGGYLDVSTASMLLGTAALALVCNQFILASRPGFAVRTLGAKGVLALHRAAPAALLVIAAAHLALKSAVGFSMASPRALLGIAAFLAMLFLTALAAVVMGGTTLSRIALWGRRRVQEITGMSYRKARDLHNALAPTAALALVHALLASTADLGANPWGVSWLVIWFLLAQAMYARYRLSGRGGADAKSSKSGGAL
ncbi:MAG TPA: hypothetical protein VLH39_04015 [Magnetospirillaceae bacterium]|nr:hypothetical protein [Magnetospirillaceae bacterium]